MVPFMFCVRRLRYVSGGEAVLFLASEIYVSGCRRAFSQCSLCRLCFRNAFAHLYGFAVEHAGLPSVLRVLGALLIAHSRRAGRIYGYENLLPRRPR